MVFDLNPDCGVTYAVSDRIARITLNRPPVNALTLDMIRGVVAALKRAAADEAVRAVILTSALPRRFCAGLDLDVLLEADQGKIRELLQALYLDLHDAQRALGKPSIAAVGGAARGGGMTLAISCDVILAAESASFGYPEIDIGVLPAIHFAHLPRIVGRHRAFELLFSGRSFAAQEALDLGLVSKVVADSDLATATMALAETFAAKSPAAMRLGRAAFMRQNDGDERRRIADAVEDFCQAAANEAAREGIRAFVEKRKPNWQT
jgi:enoyl-CoA hydratase/carnithine racemase